MNKLALKDSSLFFLPFPISVESHCSKVGCSGWETPGSSNYTGDNRPAPHSLGPVGVPKILIRLIWRMGTRMEKWAKDTGNFRKVGQGLCL